MRIKQMIIPYQELPGNYNRTKMHLCASHDYTIPRTTRELQLGSTGSITTILLYHTKNYQGTTTRIMLFKCQLSLYHTKNYQGTTTVKLGFAGYNALYHTKNYQGTTTRMRDHVAEACIIPYQELPGNYNFGDLFNYITSIIPYQELPGNYNAIHNDALFLTIIPYRKLPWNYS